MSDVVAIVIGSAVGAATAELAHTTRAYYHDAVRPLARDLRSGATTRDQLARYSWGVSWRFVFFFAAPFAMLSGAVVSHLLFLPIEAVAIRLRRRIAAWSAGAVIGAAAIAVTIGAHRALDASAVDLGTHLGRLIDPVRWLYPLVPVVAALKLPRPRAGVVATGGSAGASAVGLALAGHAALAGPLAALAGAGALVAMHVAASPRRSAITLASSTSGPHVRRGLLMLLVIGAGIGSLAAMHRLAGDPLAALLISRDHTLDALVIALLVFLAFWPMVAVSTVAADSYSTQGTPDLVPAAGYAFTGLAWAGAAAGAVALAAEVGLRRRSLQLVMTRPVLNEIAAAVRDALGEVSLLALLIGGFALASATAGALGLLAVGVAWLLNEHLGAPVTRLAVAPAAALLVATTQAIWATIT